MPERINSTVLDDAGLTAFFARELESIKAQTYDVKRPPLNAMRLIPVSSEAGPAAETIVYRQWDATGIAKIIANYADDLPRADVKAREFVARVRSIGNAYGFSLQEIRASESQGKGLDQRKASAALRSQEELWNDIGFNGDETHGLQGLFDNPNIPSEEVENDGEGDATEWSTKTPDQILRDMNDFVHDVNTRTNGVERPDTLVLPLEQFSLISSTPRSDTSDTTILEFFLRNNRFITSVESAHELAGSGPAGEDQMWTYPRSPEFLTLEMPQMFEQLPVQERNLEFVVPCHSRIGGVIVYYPFAMAFAYGI
ncbi:MAG: DUF2184 domain-containing protein [Gemmatimonadota bacterium]